MNPVASTVPGSAIMAHDVIAPKTASPPAAPMPAQTPPPAVSPPAAKQVRAAIVQNIPLRQPSQPAPEAKPQVIGNPLTLLTQALPHENNPKTQELDQVLEEVSARVKEDSAEPAKQSRLKSVAQKAKVSKIKGFQPTPGLAIKSGALGIILLTSGIFLRMG